MSIQWDFEKGLLAFMALIILAGIGVIVWQRSVAESLLSKQAASEQDLAHIGQRTYDIENYKQAIRDDPVAKGTQAFEYLEEMMVKSQIGKRFRIASRNPTDHPGYRDTVWEMRPKETREDFGRQAVAAFLLNIEGNTMRMKVSRLRLELSGRKGATNDDWTPTFEITDRQAVATN